MKDNEFKLPVEGSLSKKKSIPVNTLQADSNKSTETKVKKNMLSKNKSKHPVNSSKKS